MKDFDKVISHEVIELFKTEITGLRKAFLQLLDEHDKEVKKNIKNMDKAFASIGIMPEEIKYGFKLIEMTSYMQGFDACIELFESDVNRLKDTITKDIH